MSREVLLAAPFLALGHLVVMAWLVNVTHGLGLDERRGNQCKLLLLTLIVSLPALLVWEAWHNPVRSWPLPALGYGALCLIGATIVLPALTVLRACRQSPKGITEQSTEIDLSEQRGRSALMGSGKRAWLLKVPGNESFRLRKREWEVAIPSLPPAWDGLSVVHVTDLHFSRSFDRRFFEAVAEETCDWEADLVLFTGDLIDDDATLDWISPVFDRWHGRLGNYAILGNHDLTHHPDQIRQALEQAGFTDLEGRWQAIAIGNSTLALGGTSYPWGPSPDHEAMPDADFRLLMSHSPDQVYRASRWGIDLMLSGHNHGGQIRFPVIGPVLMPSLYSRRFDRGYFQVGRTLLHVSQGVAGKHPLRFGCVPEVSRFVLRAVPQPRFATVARKRRDVVS